MAPVQQQELGPQQEPLGVVPGPSQALPDPSEADDILRLCSPLIQVSNDILFQMDPATGALTGLNDTFEAFTTTVGDGNSKHGQKQLAVFLMMNMKPPTFTGTLETMGGKQRHIKVAMAARGQKIVCSIQDMTEVLASIELNKQLLKVIHSSNPRYNFDFTVDKTGLSL